MVGWLVWVFLNFLGSSDGICFLDFEDIVFLVPVILYPKFPLLRCGLFVCFFCIQVILNSPALQSLLRLLSSPQESIKTEACWTVSNITAGNRAQIQVTFSAVLSNLSSCRLEETRIRRYTGVFVYKVHSCMYTQSQIYNYI